MMGLWNILGAHMIMKENLNLAELFELEETKQNIKIPKETMKNTEIVLEKDIVIDNKHFKIVSDYSEEKEAE